MLRRDDKIVGAAANANAVSSQRGIGPEGIYVCHPERAQPGGILGLVQPMACKKARSLVASLCRDDKVRGTLVGMLRSAGMTSFRDGDFSGGRIKKEEAPGLLFLCFLVFIPA